MFYFSTYSDRLDSGSRVKTKTFQREREVPTVDEKVGPVTTDRKGLVPKTGLDNENGPEPEVPFFSTLLLPSSLLPSGTETGRDTRK